MFLNFEYLSDDGTTYQLATQPDRAAASAGNLIAASGTEPLFPALYIPRRLFCVPEFDITAPPILVICNATNPAYVAGPGSTVVVSGTSYIVRAAIGEDKTTGS